MILKEAFKNKKFLMTYFRSSDMRNSITTSQVEVKDWSTGIREYHNII